MFLELLMMVGAACAFLYCRFRQKCTYWAKLGVRSPSKVYFGVGNNPITQMFLGKRSIAETFLDHYREFEGEKYYGTYGLGLAPEPILCVRDLDLAQHILVKDFDCFMDRAFGGLTSLGDTETDNLWKKTLSTLKGEEWRAARRKFTPIFTSDRLKNMMHFMDEAAIDMTKILERAAHEDRQINIHQLSESFSMETIGSCVFGVRAGCFECIDSEFIENAKTIFRRGILSGLKLIAHLTPLRHLMNALNLGVMEDTPAKFLRNLVTSTMSHRKNTGSRRNDLIDLLIDATQKNPDMDLDVIVATAMVLLIAGYDTTGNSLGIGLWLLALRQDLQEKLQAEIDGVCQNDGVLDYAAIQEAEYLDKFVTELMRRYPVGSGGISRTCTQDYTLPGTNLTIKRGQEVQIPAMGIHLDEKYYPDPERFDPERFSKGSSGASRHPMSYLSFGQGPRKCFGGRFAILEIKVALVRVLKEFDIVRCKNTPEELILDPTSITMSPKNELLVRLEKRRGTA